MELIDLISDSTYFAESAKKLGFSTPIIVEKDFWVVWLLGVLFSDQELSKDLVFKGGTSLSKAFQAINRFSEDIDFTISRTAFGLEIPTDDLCSFGSKRRKKVLEELDNKLKIYIKMFVQQLEKKLLDLLPSNNRWKLYTDAKDRSVIYFEYPRPLEQNIGQYNSYIRPRIILEFGLRGAVFPTVPKQITSYLEHAFPGLELCSKPNISILSIERTFWEKATLLYMVTRYPADKPIRSALARHYYDIVMMKDKNFDKPAIKKIDLLKDVVKQKQFFFKNSWVDYNDIFSKGIKLIPESDKLKLIEKDYRSMDEMFFDSPPSFQYIIQSLTDLEKKINEATIKLICSH